MKTYFEDLNYSLSNEDTQIESDLLARLRNNKTNVLTVCGAGARVTPLMQPHVSRIDVVDVSEPQLKLLRLRLESIKKFDHNEFLQFWGYASNTESRIKMLSALELSSEDLSYWQAQSQKWENGFLFSGRWEGFLVKLGKIFRELFFVNFQSLFECESIEARRNWFEKNFPQKRLKIFLNIFANPLIFNFFLYRGKFAQSNESFPDFLNRVFYQILILKDPKQSFFAQMLFLGRLQYSEGWPIEAKKEIFERSKGFRGELNILRADLISTIQENTDYHFLSLSDVVSYLSDAQLGQLEVAVGLQRPENSITVMRSFRRHPQFSAEFIRKINPVDVRQAEQSDSIGVYKFHILSHDKL